MSSPITSPNMSSRAPSPSSSAQIPALTREQEQHQRRLARAHIRQLSKHEDDLNHAITRLETELGETKKEVTERKANQERLQNELTKEIKGRKAGEEHFNDQISQLCKERIANMDLIEDLRKDFATAEEQMAAQIKDLKEKVAALEMENRRNRSSRFAGIMRGVDAKLDSVMLETAA